MKCRILDCIFLELWSFEIGIDRLYDFVVPSLQFEKKMIKTLMKLYKLNINHIRKGHYVRTICILSELWPFEICKKQHVRLNIVLSALSFASMMCAKFIMTDFPQNVFFFC